MKRTLVRIASVLALTAGMVTGVGGTASAHPGHGWMKNNDTGLSIRAQYYYAGDLRYKWVAPGSTVDPSHTSDVERVYVANCRRAYVTYYAANGYTYSRTLTGPTSFAISNGGFLSVNDIWYYGC